MTEIQDADFFELDTNSEDSAKKKQPTVLYSVTIGVTSEEKIFTHLQGNATLLQFLGLLSVGDDTVKAQLGFHIEDKK